MVYLFFFNILGFVLPKGANQSEICAIYNQATEIILNILQGYNQVTLIRNAVRFTFARLVTCLGTQVLPYLPSLINNLLTECQITELVDFLPFITLVGHTYRPGIEPIIDELLLPLVRRVYDFLNTQPSGTDEAVILVDLQKTYLNFIVSLFNSGLENVFISERNVEHLNTILQTVLHFAKDSSNSTTQKMAFGVFLKMVNSWTSQNVFVPFVYNEIIPATFTVPMDSNFNIINGQNVMVK